MKSSFCKYSHFFKAALLSVIFAVHLSAKAETLLVGCGEKYEKPSQAARVAKDGDTILIKKGVYIDVATWDASNLTIKGMEGAANTIIRFSDSIERIACGKALWVVGGYNCRIEGVSFEGAKCPDKNAAGLWIGAAKGKTVVRQCKFTKNENGILTPDHGEAELCIDECTFRDCGHGDGYSHNLYVGRIKKLVFKNSVSDHALRGHNLKSRARETEILNSVFDDGKDGVSSYLVNCPNGGKVSMKNCRLVQSPMASNSMMVSIGEEGAYPDTVFNNIGNKFVNLRTSTTPKIFNSSWHIATENKKEYNNGVLRVKY
jgi:hypothetical protein